MENNYSEYTRNFPNIKNFIIKNDIPQNMYIFASYSKKKDIYTQLHYESTYRAKKLLINKNWVDKHFGTSSKNKQLPPLLLFDKKDFLKKNEHGKHINITIRGEPNHDHIFFNAKDIGKILEENNIIQTLYDSQFSLKEDRDFTYFHNIEQNDNKTSCKNIVAYFTFIGLFRFLTIQKHPIVNQFLDWTEKHLFSQHITSPKEKFYFRWQINTMKINILQEYLNTATSSMPVVYLFYLGNMKDVCEKMNIDKTKYPHITDSYQVFKYGSTDNFQKQTEELHNIFGKYNIIPTLTYCVHIDPYYFQEAQRISDWFKLLSWHLEEIKQDFSELGVTPLHTADSSLNTLFHDIDKMFSGKIHQFKKEIEVLKIDNEKYQELIDLFKKQSITYQNEKYQNGQLLHDTRTESKQTIDDNKQLLHDINTESKQNIDDNNKHENTIAFIKKSIDDIKSIFTKTLQDNNKKYDDFLILQKEKDLLYQNTITLYQNLLQQSKI